MDDKTLKLIQLAKNDYRVYESALRGNATIKQLCFDTRIHRRNLYDCITKLLNLGLLSFSEQNRQKLYIPSPPEIFLDIIRERKNEVFKTELKIRGAIKILKSIKVERKNPFNVQVFIGKEGLKNVYNDILKTGRDYIGYGNGRQLEKVMRFYLQNFIKKRIEKGISIRQIYDESSRGYKYTRNPLLKVRYLPDQYCSLAALRIYGTKIVIMLLDIKEPLAIMIDNSEIADGYRKYFEVLWKFAKP